MFLLLYDLNAQVKKKILSSVQRGAGSRGMEKGASESLPLDCALCGKPASLQYVSSLPAGDALRHAGTDAGMHGATNGLGVSREE
jgi:hypothetical protein